MFDDDPFDEYEEDPSYWADDTMEPWEAAAWG